MIKGTNPNIKVAQNRLQSPENGGFIRLFILILILAAILIYFEIDPVKVWEGLFKPILKWFFDLSLRFIEFLFNIAVWIIDKAKSIFNI